MQKSLSSLYSNFILNLYTVYELKAWPCNSANNFTQKNCLFCTVKLTINADKSKSTYNGLGIALDGEGSWSFDNDFVRNAITFSADNSSLSHTDNRENNLCV